MSFLLQWLHHSDTISLNICLLQCFHCRYDDCSPLFRRLYSKYNGQVPIRLNQQLLAEWIKAVNMQPTRDLSSHIDMHTHSGSTLHNPVTFDLLTSRSMNVEFLPQSIWVPNLVFDNSSFPFTAWTHTHRHMDSHTSSYRCIGYCRHGQ